MNTATKLREVPKIPTGTLEAENVDSLKLRLVKQAIIALLRSAGISGHVKFEGDL